jgi:hypothetical protein
MNWFHLKACLKCGGDLVLDEGDWRCLQCGTYYYIGLYRQSQPMEWPWLGPNPGQGKAFRGGLTGTPEYSAGGGLALPGAASRRARVLANA